MLLNRSLIPIRVGSLFVAAGLVNPQALSEALAASRQEKILIGEVLLDRGLVGQDELKAALDLQQLIRDGNISLELAGRALKKVRHEQSSVHRALSDSGWRLASAHEGCSMSRLLMRAELVSKQQLEQAKVTSEQTGIPVGRALVLNGALTPSLLNATLSCLVMIRDGHLNENRAANVLRVCHKNRQPFEEVMAAPETHRMRIGDLLRLSGILSDSDASTALEMALSGEKLTGSVLLEHGYVSQQVLDAALKIQEMLDGGILTLAQGPEIVRQVFVTGVPVTSFINAMEKVRTGAFSLLLEAGIVSLEQLDFAASEFPDLIGNSLRLAQTAGLVDADTVRQSIRLAARVADGEIASQAACSELAAARAVVVTSPVIEPSPEPVVQEAATPPPVETTEPVFTGLSGPVPEAGFVFVPIQTRGPQVDASQGASAVARDDIMLLAQVISATDDLISLDNAVSGPDDDEIGQTQVIIGEANFSEASVLAAAVPAAKEPELDGATLSIFEEDTVTNAPVISPAPAFLDSIDEYELACQADAIADAAIAQQAQAARQSAGQADDDQNASASQSGSECVEWAVA